MQAHISHGNGGAGQTPNAAPIVQDSHARERRRITNLNTVARVDQPSTDSIATGGNALPAIGGKNHGGENWDHLRHWQPGNDEDDEIIDVRDDISSDNMSRGEEEEDEEDEAEAEEDELHQESLVEANIVPEPRPRPLRQGKLSRENIVEVINECIEEFSTKWWPGKNQNASYTTDPKLLWEKAEKEGRRLFLVENHKATLKYLQSRLDAIGDAIAASDNTTEKEFRAFCATLEGTVEQIEEAEWLLSIYELEPEEEDSGINTQTDQPRKSIVIDLGSDSDSESSGDEMDIDNTAPTAVTPGSMNVVLDEPVLAPDVIHISDDEVLVDADLAPLFTPAMTSTPGENRRPISMEGRALPRSIPDRLADKPGLSSITSVSRWDWNTLVAKRDRPRIVMKILHEVSSEDREMIRTRLNELRKQTLLKEIRYCVHMFIRGEAKIPGVLPRDLAKVVTCTKFFLCWWLADNYFKKTAPEWRLEELSQCLESGSEDIGIFYDWVRYILANTFSKEALRKPFAPSQAEIITISDDDDDEAPQPTKIRRRRFPIR